MFVGKAITSISGYGSLSWGRGVAKSREGTGVRGGAEVVAWLSEEVGLVAGA